MTLSPRTRAKLDAFARVSGMSRGAIVEAALEAVEVCEKCHGTGFYPFDDKGGGERCPDCGGHRIIPTG